MDYVKDVMATHPHLVAPEATLRDAAKEMRTYECGALVIGNEDKPVGIITDRDIVIFGLADDKDPDAVQIREIMTTELFTCDQEQTLEEAADIMSDCDVRRLVVLNDDQKVVGVLSVSDMVKRADSDDINDEVIHHLFKYA